MGRRRIFVDFGRSGALRVTIAAAGASASGIAEAFIHIAENEVRRRNGLWNGLGHHKIAVRASGVRAFGRLGRGNFATDVVPRNTCRRGSRHKSIQRRMESGGSGSSGGKV